MRNDLTPPSSLLSLSERTSGCSGRADEREIVVVIRLDSRRSLASADLGGQRRKRWQDRLGSVLERVQEGVRASAPR
jgi:hypothetical protein